MKVDENMPEKLTEYRIWFSEENGIATIISSDENESYGELDETNRKVLEKELVK